MVEERSSWHGLRVSVRDARPDERDRRLQEPTSLQRGRIPRQDTGRNAQLAHGTSTAITCFSLTGRLFSLILFSSPPDTVGESIVRSDWMSKVKGQGHSRPRYVVTKTPTSTLGL